MPDEDERAALTSLYAMACNNLRKPWLEIPQKISIFPCYEGSVRTGTVTQAMHFRRAFQFGDSKSFQLKEMMCNVP